MGNYFMYNAMGDVFVCCLYNDPSVLCITNSSIHLNFVHYFRAGVASLEHEVIYLFKEPSS